MKRDKEITISDEDGTEIVLASKWVICPTCIGEGKTSFAVDGHGITQQERELDWDEESWEAYLQGAYDRSCSDCGGSGKVRVVDEDRLSVKQQALWSAWQQDEYEYRTLREMERRMGC